MGMIANLIGERWRWRSPPLAVTITLCLWAFLAFRGLVEAAGYEAVRGSVGPIPPAISIVRREVTLALWLLFTVPWFVAGGRRRPIRWPAPRPGRLLAWHGSRALAGASVYYFVHYGVAAVTGWDGYPTAASEVLTTYVWSLSRYGPQGLIWYLVVLLWTNIHDSTLELRSQELRESRLQSQFATSRLETLRARLQPHFLYNTMHTISTLIPTAPADARVMLARLGNLLRASVEETAELVPLERELELLHGYLQIEQARFGDRLTVETSVEPGAEDLLVPPLILQPLAENAVRHGLAQGHGEGQARVEIRARREGDRLVLEVADNGAGPGASPPSPGGIGLATTRERLERLFPEEHGLELTRRPGGGTEVRIRVPARRKENP